MSLSLANSPAARANDSFSDNNSSDESSSAGHTSEDEDGDDDDGHPMMSIFASYYGIEDPSAAAEDNTPKGTIDDAGFQPEKFVKVQSSSLQLLNYNSQIHVITNYSHTPSTELANERTIRDVDQN